MSTPARINVLVVRADGRGIKRLSIPRWSTRVAATVVAVGALANATLIVDYARVRRDHGAMLAHREQIERRARALEPIERRLTDLRDEIVGWDTLHAAIVKPLGEERRASVGIGGP